jgi:hypothetical protein
MSGVATESGTAKVSLEKSARLRDQGRAIPWAYLSVAVLVLLMAVQVVLSGIRQLPRLDEVGYGDSYVAYDVKHFLETGVIYRPPTEAPYNPVLYSPLLYTTLALPERWSLKLNPFFGPRIVVLSFFCFCVVLCGSLARKLGRHRAVMLWACALAMSIQIFDGWLCQLRSDFLAAAFSLLAIRLLMNRSRWTIAAAGIAAGVAFLFKLTFVAAIIAGLVWLIWNKRVRHALEFAIAAGFAGLSGYGFFYLREPQMLRSMLSVRSPVIDNKGAAEFLVLVIGQPVLILAVSMSLYMGWRFGRNWRLLFLFAGVSASVAMVTSRQAGANVNYYFEALLALAPAASVAILELRRTRIIGGMPRFFLAGVVAVVLIIPNVERTLIALHRLDSAALRERNAKLAALTDVLHNMTAFSAVPRFSLMCQAPPPITEPFLLRYLEMKHRVDLEPLRARVEAKDFELAITYVQTPSFRGVENLSPSLADSIQTAYVPFCKVDDVLIRIRKGIATPNAALKRLVNAGCVPMGAQGGDGADH